MIYLTRIDPGRRMYRWYRISLQASLFSPLVVVTEWGSLHSAFHRQKARPAATEDEAHQLIQRTLAVRLRRGYQIVRQEP
ncbi:MAG TPA: WGR domain-containing protein [Anaerolineaceae bacterium]|nr:WGR domain-containing protein [Anaerolineaceae bacterium]HQF61592.1 WGR domain-containing protein [Anaerolineaceae bacterium]HQH84109.1 WGR domain-containing protein [Anaerolineaceae bacterium]HQN44352.1 WGR domain-containing protein [Anaerolineaceae bacterium]